MLAYIIYSTVPCLGITNGLKSLFDITSTIVVAVVVISTTTTAVRVMCMCVV